MQKILHLGFEIPPPRMQKNTTYFFKASGIILSNFGKINFFPLKMSKYFLKIVPQLSMTHQMVVINSKQKEMRIFGAWSPRKICDLNLKREREDRTWECQPETALSSNNDFFFIRLVKTLSKPAGPGNKVRLEWLIKPTFEYV